MSPDPHDDTVRGHYGKSGLIDRIYAALTAVGKDIGSLKPEDLTPVDEFHTRGPAATKDLARLLAIKPGERVLDLGCGIGGPARYLKRTFAVSVIGVDLTPEFIDTAVALSERVGMGGQIAFQVANALHIPFPDESFDIVWSQNVAMNIADRAGLYREIRRVLKPGGRYGFTDITQGAGGPLHYPMPWASRPEFSHLLSIDETRASLEAAGLSVSTLDDQTADAAAQAQARITKDGPVPSPLSTSVLIGNDFTAVVTNMARNLAESRMHHIQAVAVRT